MQNAAYRLRDKSLRTFLVVTLNVLIAVGGLSAAIGSAAAADRCPDVSGRYSIAGFGKALGDTLDVLHAGQAGFQDSGIQLHGPIDGELTIGVKSGRTGTWSTSPVAVLHQGQDFDCRSGVLVFRPLAQTSRKTDEGIFYEGASIVSMSRQGGEVALDVAFTGSQRISLYSYDSANVSVPRFGTRTTLKDAIRWPVFSEPVAPLVATPVTPMGELAVRNQLTTGVLGNVMMGWVSTQKDGVEVTFNAPRSDDIAPFEQRLRAAAIDYRMKQAPIWTNGAYYMVLVIVPPHG